MTQTKISKVERKTNSPERRLMIDLFANGVRKEVRV